MTAPISTVPAVRTWLYGVITNAVATFTAPTCEVYYSQEDHQSAEDIVVIGGAHRRTPPTAMIGSGGAGWIHELYTIDVEIAAYIAGADPFPDVDTRAYGYLSVIEQAVRADPSAGGNVVQLNPEGSTSEHTWDEDALGGHCNITLTLAVHATQ